MFSICCFIVVLILCSHTSLCFHKMFSLCFHNCYLMALLDLFFWVRSIFILFVLLIGFIIYRMIICARFCHDIVTPILFCHVYNVSLCISIACIIELPLLLAMSIFLASNCALPCLQCVHLCTILLPHHFVLFYKSSFLCIFFVYVCFVMLWRSGEAMDLCWWNDGSLLFYHPRFLMDRILQNDSNENVMGI